LSLSARSSDFELMQRVANYDSRALELLYNRYSPLLYTLIKKIAGEEEKAEIILTEVFVIIWKKTASHFDLQMQNVYSWIITLARNKAVDYIKREKNELPSYTDEYEDKYIIPHQGKGDPLDLSSALSIKDAIENSLNLLTEAQQYVVYLGYYKGLSQEEIAAKLNIPLPTVRAKIKQALNNLRDNLRAGIPNE
jgi:RNA polymerase sigma-70 factor, ECF subfamily